MNLSTQVLVFQNTEFSVVDRDGQPWLRLPQIEGALGYAHKGRALMNIFLRHADEFTEHMTTLVQLVTGRGRQMVRCFSLRGAHLLAMFARTPVAKAFRRWVLDILDKQVVRARPAATPDSTVACLQLAVQALVASAKSLSYQTVYRLVRQRFHVTTMDKIPTEQVPMAIEFVKGLAAHWELVGDVALPAPTQLLSALDRESLTRLCADAEFVRSWWAAYGPGLEHLNPRAASMVSEHIAGAASGARIMVRHLGLESFEAYAMGYPWRGTRQDRAAYSQPEEVAP